MTERMLTAKSSITKVSKLFILLIFASSFTLEAQNRMTHREYVEKYKELAIYYQETYGIPASIKLAQGLLESDCGNSRLAVEANNHFGIKCKSDWTGESIRHDDDAANECFRKYSSAEESYYDHSEFLDKSWRYQELFKLDITDYKGWAHGLKEAGYATNPQYAQLLIKLIEDHKLYLIGKDIDYAEVVEVIKEAGSEPETLITPETDKVDIDNYMVAMYTINNHPVFSNNGSEFIVAGDGDSYASISKAVGVNERRLRKFNDVSRSQKLTSGDMVYVKAKQNRVTNGKRSHTVKEGETLHQISQTYGVKLKRLAKLNRRSVNDPVHAGELIRLL